MRSDRAWWVALLAIALGGCPSTPFHCEGDTQCSASAVCTPTGACAERVERAVCASGLRYAASAPQPGACVPVPDGGAATDLGDDDATMADAQGVDAQGVDAPVVDAPVLDTPVVDAPVLDVPVLDVPVLDVPVLDVPVLDVPVLDVRVVDAPVVDAPVIDAPSVDVPSVDRPDVVALDAPVDVPVCDPPRQLSPISGTRLAGADVDLLVSQTNTLVEVSSVSDFSRDVVTLTPEARGNFHVRRASHGVYFWRARTRCSVSSLSAPSPTWSFWLRGDQGIAGTTPSGPIGWIPDVNGDGLGDVVIGRPSLSITVGHDESVEVIFGVAGAVPDRSRAVTLPHTPTPMGFGAQVAVVPDLNGDGLAEVAVSYCTYPPRSTCGGEVTVYPGSRGGALGTPWRLNTAVPLSRFGVSLAGAGDLNSDGYGDMVIGGPGGTTDPGYVFVVTGSATGPRVAAVHSRSADTTSTPRITLFGWRVAGPGDVTGDGVADVVLTSFERAWVYPGAGPSTTPLGPALEVTGYFAGAEGLYGFQVGPGGDLNNDGIADFVLSRPGQPVVSGLLAGDVAVMSGRRGAATFTSSSVFAGEGGQRLGFALGGAVDVHADGFDDVMVGAPMEIGATGMVRMIAGAATPVLDVPARVVIGTTTRFGRSVAGLGDVDGDRRDEFGVGAGDPTAATNGGSFVSITRGSPTAPLSAWVSFPVAADPDFGTSIARRDATCPLLRAGLRQFMMIAPLVPRVGAAPLCAGRSTTT